MAYSVTRPSSPVPISRRAIVVDEAAKRFWEMFTRYRGDDQWKWFDCDLALREGADLLQRLTVLAELKGDAYVHDLIERAIAAAQPSEAA